jgi:hypothetical protein
VIAALSACGSGKTKAAPATASGSVLASATASSASTDASATPTPSPSTTCGALTAIDRLDLTTLEEYATATVDVSSSFKEEISRLQTAKKWAPSAISGAIDTITQGMQAGMDGKVSSIPQGYSAALTAYTQWITTNCIVQTTPACVTMGKIMTDATSTNDSTSLADIQPIIDHYKELKPQMPTKALQSDVQVLVDAYTKAMANDDSGMSTDQFNVSSSDIGNWFATACEVP